jgi:hypothetical protein
MSRLAPQERSSLEEDMKAAAMFSGDLLSRRKSLVRDGSLPFGFQNQTQSAKQAHNPSLAGVLTTV